ncbi:MAG: sensor histidine kinase [Lachnospiraceae bacterium]|jgi:two-component system sensor histidine kinase YesM|nr:sensor histidine kinase [Lachnospiraceae bacterium]
MVFDKYSIRYHIFIYFTVTALAASIFIGLSLYTRLSGLMADSIREENQILINQVNRSVDSYLRSIMKLSDSLYYGVIKNADLSDDSIANEMTLLYDNNKDNVENIALLSKEGVLLEAVPAARLKTGVDVTGESWFKEARERTENVHFSLPHVQYVFDVGDTYRWVVSVSRAVEITQGPYTDQGILLIDVRYDSLEQLIDGVNLGNNGYVYLLGPEGRLICHPDSQLIDSGLVRENHLAAAEYQDGNHVEEFMGKKRLITVKTVGYTGWKIVGVTPLDGMSLNAIKTRLLIVFIVGFVLFILTIINSFISSRITGPIKELEKSVGEIEAGNLEARVYVGGSYETRHLGASIQHMAEQIRRLMDDIVAEHESKRKSEFDALQSQINPHFLYNTLDIIVWMIENEKQGEAVKAVTALARFFRISLSKGKNIIPVSAELEHVRSYLMIQHMRYKNRFSYTIEAEDEVLGLCSLKLLLQPLVENAIYHGMEFMDGDGEIAVRAWQEGEDLYLSVSDNGLGMTKEQIDRMFADGAHVPSRRGSGIGVRNVNERIKLYFGREYGLSVSSELDVGTTVTARLKAVVYEEATEDESHVK